MYLSIAAQRFFFFLEKNSNHTTILFYNGIAKDKDKGKGMGRVRVGVRVGVRLSVWGKGRGGAWCKGKCNGV